MSYDVSLCVKVEGTEKHVDIADIGNITWNVGDLIRESSGWDISANNCRIGMTARELRELLGNGVAALSCRPEDYRQYEAPNGWGTVGGTLRFFVGCIDGINDIDPDLLDVARVRVH